ncbi:stAR-related lipid transfer protein 6-like [Saccoglossus kowalevskii]
MHVTQSDEFDGILVKVECIMDFPPHKIVEMSLDFEWLKTFEERIIVMEVAEKIDEVEKLQIFHLISGDFLFGLISSREFVSLFGVRHLPDKNAILIYNRSVDHPDYPEVNDRVRGHMYSSGKYYYSIEGEPNKTRFVEFTQTDVKMSIPNFLLEQLAPKFAKHNLEKLTTHANERLKREVALKEDSTAESEESNQ